MNHGYGQPQMGMAVGGPHHPYGQPAQQYPPQQPQIPPQQPQTYPSQQQVVNNQTQPQVVQIVQQGAQEFGTKPVSMITRWNAQRLQINQLKLLREITP